MSSLADQLKKLIKINRQILNQLNKDDATLESMRDAFDKREIHSRKIEEIVSHMDKDKLSDKESASLKALFSKFEKQGKKIQEAFGYIIKESRDKLGDAVKSRKAEDSYQILK